MELLCEEEIIWSPCLPIHDDEESDLDPSSSSPLTFSNSSIDCLSSSIYTINSPIIQCSISCRFIDHDQCCSSSCNTDNLCDQPPETSDDDALQDAARFPCIDEQELKCMLEKQFDYMPEKHYYSGLQLKKLSPARSRAIQWLVEAQNKFNFASTTIALAINYFDRYLSSNLSKVWSNWMLDLLSTVCLSIAAKMEEVVVPHFLDLQQGARKHAFDSLTIQRMEVLLLSTLQWKMRSITPFSFVEIALCGIDISSHLRDLLQTRISELLFGALLDAECLQFDSSTLATSSIFCALREIAPSHIHQFQSLHVATQTLSKNQDDFWRCCKLMDDDVFSSSDDGVTLISPYVNAQLMASTSSSPQHGEVVRSFLLEPKQGFGYNTHSSEDYVHLCALSTSSKKRKHTQAFGPTFHLASIPNYE